MHSYVLSLVAAQTKEILIYLENKAEKKLLKTLRLYLKFLVGCINFFTLQ